MTLLEPYNLPFLLALIALVLVSLAQIVGLGDVLDAGDADLDAGAGAGADSGAASGGSGGGMLEGAFSLLGLGRVPALIWLMVLMFLFAAIGVSGQQLAMALIGAPLNPVLAAVLAGLAALPVNGVLTRPLARILPRDETTAVSLDSLVRRDGVIQIGTARAGSPARAKVVDIFGHPHFVMVEPHDPQIALSEGETVLLVRREGERFFAVRYESRLLQID